MIVRLLVMTSQLLRPYAAVRGECGSQCGARGRASTSRQEELHWSVCERFGVALPSARCIHGILVSAELPRLWPSAVWMISYPILAFKVTRSRRETAMYFRDAYIKLDQASNPLVSMVYAKLRGLPRVRITFFLLLRFPVSRIVRHNIPLPFSFLRCAADSLYLGRVRPAHRRGHVVRAKAEGVGSGRYTQDILWPDSRLCYASHAICHCGRRGDGGRERRDQGFQWTTDFRTRLLRLERFFALRKLRTFFGSSLLLVSVPCRQ